MLRVCKRSIRNAQRLKERERPRVGNRTNLTASFASSSHRRTAASISLEDNRPDQYPTIEQSFAFNVSVSALQRGVQPVGPQFASFAVGYQTPEQRFQGKIPSLHSSNNRDGAFDGSLGSSLSSSVWNRNHRRLDRLHASPTHHARSVAWMSTGPSLKTNDEDERGPVLKAAAPIQPLASPPHRPPSVRTQRSIPPRKLGKTAVPTPATGPDDPMDQLSNSSTKSIISNGSEMVLSVLKMVLSFTLRLPSNLWYFITHPSAASERIQSLWDAIKHEAHHYYVGTKLLWEEMKTARKLLFKTLDGTALTRRERKQLLRTVSDLFRLIPFSMFVLIPFMEFALPFALRIFPNMLPSTYQDSLKAEETMKRELQSRIAMTEFFQETLEELAKKQKKKATKREKELKDAGDDGHDFTAHRDSAASMLEFLAKARNGEMIPSDVLYRYANYFQDDLTLDNMPRMQLINMCRYMGIQPYGSESFLRFQLRHKIRTIKEDDGRILWEGIDSLNKMELREACQERGMRSTGLSKEAYRRALKEWLDLSVNKDVPIALLIMSRTFFLREDVFHPPEADDANTMSGLADAISGLDKEIVNEAILEVATHDEKKSDPEVRKIKLEVLSQQNELIREEEEAREAAAKKHREEEEAAKKESMEATKESSTIDSEFAELETNATIDVTSPSPATMELNDAPVSEEELKQQPTSDPLAAAAPQPAESTLAVAIEEEKETPTVAETVEDKSEESGSLSPEEMDAISQLVTDDPVLKERTDLERIKAAMKEEAEEQAKLAEEEEQQEEMELASHTATLVSETQQQMPESMDPTAAGDGATVDEDKVAKEAIEAMDQKALDEADAATTVTVDDHLPKDEAPVAATDSTDEEEGEDPIVARLKKRVKSMVDKIEVQLTETQIKIGDKLHFLDKDKDGIFTSDEMAEAIQTVLRREISFDEALEIAKNMDVNEDGFIRVDELIRWIDEHKLVEFVKEGRDAEMDRIMENHASQTKPEEPATTKPQ